VLGQSGGSETVSLLVTQMPAHDHAPAASSAVGTTAAPANGVSGRDPAGTLAWTNSPGAAVQSMAASHISTTGGSQPHANLMPVLALNFVIAIEGIYPSMG
jgi:microcystin-dependent protein